jgi:hypothetical protein
LNINIYLGYIDAAIFSRLPDTWNFTPGIG